MLILLDPGHGPFTAGKRSPDGRLREYHVNAAIAKFVKEALCGVADCQLTTTGEKDVPLWERSQLANHLKADLFVSIHANAYGSNWNAVSGIETYVAPRASKQSHIVAKAVQAQLVKSTGRLDRGVKTGNFHVLTRTKMPAILVEVGFMTNRVECDLLLSEEYQRKCAMAIVAAICATL
ncbi:N-acetylmuramoyl-L-alanine amidase [Chryseomicrobium sp. FSL W7-1435]|uniref:N-acetylmuramoyl-L-alanine amidase family protein n=1 Tax=Chryseomicrobium sp. FSL W7-1435 TaxID=2921704 RepID=UPI003159BEBC